MAKKVRDLGKKGLSALAELLNKKPEGVVGVVKEGEEWKVTVDVLERKAVPDTQDLVGRYELRFTEEGELLGYSQLLIRRRQEPIARPAVEGR